MARRHTREDGSPDIGARGKFYERHRCSAWITDGFFSKPQTPSPFSFSPAYTPGKCAKSVKKPSRVFSGGRGVFETCLSREPIRAPKFPRWVYSMKNPNTCPGLARPMFLCTHVLAREQSLFPWSHSWVLSARQVRRSIKRGRGVGLSGNANHSSQFLLLLAGDLGRESANNYQVEAYAQTYSQERGPPFRGWWLWNYRENVEWMSFTANK